MLQLQLPTHRAQCNQEYVVLHDLAYIKKELFMEMVSAHSVEGYIRIHYSAKKTELTDTLLTILIPYIWSSVQHCIICS